MIGSAAGDHPPVARDGDRGGAERVGRLGAREQDDPAHAPVPEELLGRAAARRAERLDERDVPEAGAVDPGEVAGHRRADVRGVVAVEHERADRGEHAGDPGEAERDRGSVLSAHEHDGEHREDPGRDRDHERPGPHREQPLEPEHGEQERRVLLVVGGGEAGERHAHREEEHRAGDERDREPVRPAAPRVEAEGERDERQQREQVALLVAGRPSCGVDRRLDEDPRGDEERQRAERPLDAGARAGECEREPDDRPRDQDPAGRVGEHHRVDRRPLQRGEGGHVVVPDHRVVAEHPRGPEPDHRDDGKPEQREGRPVAADAPALDEERRREEGDRQHRVLDPREGREPGDRHEGDLRLPRRRLERAHAEVERGEDERIGDRVGEQERGEEEVRRGDRERGGAEREAGAEPEPAGEQVDGDRGERHRERVQAEREPVGQHRVVEEPERRGEQRLEQRREVGGLAADRELPGLGQAAGERAVDVLVGEVQRDRVREHGREAEDEAQRDDSRERVARGDRGDPRCAERARAGGRIDCHGLAIGRSGASLDRGVCRPGPDLRSRA